jgi:hypothetical protein
MADKDQPKRSAQGDERKPVVGMPFKLEDLIAAAITMIVKRPRKRRIPR